MAKTFIGTPVQPLRTIVKLNDDAFGTLLQSVRKEPYFDRSFVRCDKLAQSMGDLEATEVFGIIGLLDFLYDRVQESDGELPTSERVSEALKNLGLFKYIEKDSEGLARLTKLLAPIESLDKEQKLQWLTTGILDTAVGFSSFVDLRPDFSSDRKNIKDMVPITIFRISTENDYDESKSLVFQLSEESLGKLKDAVSDAYLKLSMLKRLSRSVVSQTSTEEKD